MKLIKDVVLTLLTLIPMLSFANGTYKPGTVYVFNSSGYGYTQAYYNVRYNPAATYGNISVAIIPDQQQIVVFARNTTDNQTFMCTATPATVGTDLYNRWEYIITSLLSGGNGAYVFANGTNGVCGDITISSSSTRLD